MNNDDRPNFLVLCLDQWDPSMPLPPGASLPALERLEARGVSFGRQYCTYPICTPSRSTMWTGVHAIHTGLWDNTNFLYIDELSSNVPTIGHMLRDAGYYTAFKGKWHLSETPRNEGALERYGFSDYQQWSDMFGEPLQGSKLDGAVAFEAKDWLESKATTLDQPWLLVCSLVNPHDVMYLQTDDQVVPEDVGITAGIQTTVQELGWFDQDWDPALPVNFDDDLSQHPPGVAHYRDYVDMNYGHIPAERRDLWVKHRNYLFNCMRLADYQFSKVLDSMDELGLWDNTIVIFTGDHGEMNAAHRLRQKAGIAFDEACRVNLTVCVPDGLAGRYTDSVGSHLDIAPTLLDYAGVSADEVKSRYPLLKGRSLKPAISAPDEPGPRGSVSRPGDGALFMWDALHSLDNDWVRHGGMSEMTIMGSAPMPSDSERKALLLETGRKYGAPDFSKRNAFRSVVDGQFKMVRWFSPDRYGNPKTVEDLFDQSDVGLYDLVNDPGELINLAQRDHADYDEDLVVRMLQKLHHLVAMEIGDDRAPYDLDLFGTREIRYRVKE